MKTAVAGDEPAGRDVALRRIADDVRALLDRARWHVEYAERLVNDADRLADAVRPRVAAADGVHAARRAMIGAVADLSTLALRAGADEGAVSEIQARFLDANEAMKQHLPTDT